MSTADPIPSSIFIEALKLEENDMPVRTAQPVDLDAHRDVQRIEVAAAKVNGMTDPGKSAEQIALDRMQALIKDLTSGGLANLTELRDRLDDTMRNIARRGDELSGLFETFAGQVQQAVQMKAIIEPTISGLANDVEATLTPPTTRTLTQ